MAVLSLAVLASFLSLKEKHSSKWCSLLASWLILLYQLCDAACWVAIAITAECYIALPALLYHIHKPVLQFQCLLTHCLVLVSKSSGFVSCVTCAFILVTTSIDHPS